MSKRKYLISALLLALTMAFGSFGALSVHAEDGEQPSSPETEVTVTDAQTTEGSAEEEPKAPVYKWKKASGYYYCYRDGKKLTGFKTIGKVKYYFNSKGRQLTGWRKIGKSYYYFRIVNGKNGYMVKSKKVNGIKLAKTGKANVKSKRARRKVKLMVRCAKMMDSATRPAWSKGKKLKAAFKYAKTRYPRRNIYDWRKTANWDIDYAEYIINHRAGDCFCQGAFFAYLANAVGYTNVKAVSSGGHGWAMVNGKIYDPNWSFIIGDKKCYAVPRSLSGTGGRPSWSRSGRYVKDLRK